MTEALRQVAMRRAEAVFVDRPDGTILVSCPTPLGPYPNSITQFLRHWAKTAPERVFMACRDRSRPGAGDWDSMTYAQAWARVQAIGQALLARDLSPERPIVILSGNDLAHQLLGLAAMHVGIPYAPVSPAYSLVSSDFGKLRHVMALTTPGLVFAENGIRFAAAIAAAMPDDAELVVLDAPPPGRAATAFADLLATQPGPEVAAAAARVGPDTVAKLLFTSGSTGLPKAVINPQRMLCSNQEIIAGTLTFLNHTPPVMLDWSPWNHTAGGNHNVGIVLRNGGTLYIDDGKPTPAGIAETVRNLRDVVPTIYFSAPKGYEALLPFLRDEPQLRQNLFSQMQMMWYAGASLPAHIWAEFDALAVRSIGQRVPLLSGLGSTETGPFALFSSLEYHGAGNIGLPGPGVTIKLVPNDGKLELRLQSPSVTPGYWRQPEQTAKAFDAEGFYCMGDALRFADPANRLAGFMFDGRVSEDFKLTTGTWVSVGALRARLIAECAPYVRDVVIAGENRDDICAILVPEPDALRTLCPPGTTDMLGHPAVRAALAERLAVHASHATGSSTLVRRAVLLPDDLSIDKGEVTDKGSINQRAVLAHRVALVESLYVMPPPATVLAASRNARQEAGHAA